MILQAARDSVDQEVKKKRLKMGGYTDEILSFSCVAEGETLKETQNINSSLNALADVLSALSAPQSAANANNLIPYRNSKLTRLLQVRQNREAEEVTKRYKRDKRRIESQKRRDAEDVKQKGNQQRKLEEQQQKKKRTRQKQKQQTKPN